MVLSVHHVYTCLQVKALQPGDKVMSAFTTSCGSCFYCSKGVMSGRVMYVWVLFYMTVLISTVG